MDEVPAVVVVGAACRDLVDDDERGWRLGGGASYSALALASATDNESARAREAVSAQALNATASMRASAVVPR